MQYPCFPFKTTRHEYFVVRKNFEVKIRHDPCRAAANKCIYYLSLVNTNRLLQWKIGAEGTHILLEHI